MILKAWKLVQETAVRHKLTMSDRRATQYEERTAAILSQSQFSTSDTRFLLMALTGLVETVISEAQDRQFYVLERSISENYANPDHLFAPEVIDAFPNAAYDMQEAGKCLAFGLWTACVMHTMRVLEIGLNGLAGHVGVTPQANWNATLNDIEVALRQVRRSVDGAEAEHWAAEAGAHLRFIKNARRNQAMHPGWKADEAEARSVFSDARSFMRHLAKEITL